jgi:hypothetical protein
MIYAMNAFKFCRKNRAKNLSRILAIVSQYSLLNYNVYLSFYLYPHYPQQR